MRGFVEKEAICRFVGVLSVIAMGIASFIFTNTSAVLIRTEMNCRRSQSDCSLKATSWTAPAEMAKTAYTQETHFLNNYIFCKYEAAIGSISPSSRLYIYNCDIFLVKSTPVGLLLLLHTA